SSAVLDRARQWAQVRNHILGMPSTEKRIRDEAGRHLARNQRARESMQDDDLVQIGLIELSKYLDKGYDPGRGKPLDNYFGIRLDGAFRNEIARETGVHGSPDGMVITGSAKLKSARSLDTPFEDDGDSLADILESGASPLSPLMGAEQEKKDDRLLSRALGHLTKAERKVMDLMLDGKSRSDIAGELNISAGTVSTHSGNARKKTTLWVQKYQIVDEQVREFNNGYTFWDIMLKESRQELISQLCVKVGKLPGQLTTADLTNKLWGGQDPKSLGGMLQNYSRRTSGGSPAEGLELMRSELEFDKIHVDRKLVRDAQLSEMAERGVEYNFPGKAIIETDWALVNDLCVRVGKMPGQLGPDDYRKPVPWAKATTTLGWLVKPFQEAESDWGKASATMSRELRFDEMPLARDKILGSQLKGLKGEGRIHSYWTSIEGSTVRGYAKILAEQYGRMPQDFTTIDITKPIGDTGRPMLPLILVTCRRHTLEMGDALERVKRDFHFDDIVVDAGKVAGVQLRNFKAKGIAGNFWKFALPETQTGLMKEVAEHVAVLPTDLTIKDIEHCKLPGMSKGCGSILTFWQEEHERLHGEKISSSKVLELKKRELDFGLIKVDRHEMMVKQVARIRQAKQSGGRIGRSTFNKMTRETKHYLIGRLAEQQGRLPHHLSEYQMGAEIKGIGVKISGLLRGKDMEGLSNELDLELLDVDRKKVADSQLRILRETGKVNHFWPYALPETRAALLGELAGQVGKDVTDLRQSDLKKVRLEKYGTTLQKMLANYRGDDESPTEATQRLIIESVPYLMAA
ncbi:sigma-70 family RNA polymerase sigma factor, partial [Candidatus Altiarchaeota archaeon]